MNAHVTRHAADRAVERLGLRDAALARVYLERLLEHAIVIPARVLYALTGREAAPRRKGAARFYIHGSVVMVIKGDSVVTVWPLTLEELATLVVWSALRILPEATDLRRSEAEPVDIAGRTCKR